MASQAIAVLCGVGVVAARDARPPSSGALVPYAEQNVTGLRDVDASPQFSSSIAETHLVSVPSTSSPWTPLAVFALILASMSLLSCAWPLLRRSLAVTARPLNLSLAFAFSGKDDVADGLPVPGIGRPVTTTFGSMANWIVFAVCFGAEYGSFKTTVGYLTSWFTRKTADDGNFISYLVWTLTTLFVAVAVLEAWRPKWVLVGSFALYSAQFVLLLIASILRIEFIGGLLGAETARDAAAGGAPPPALPPTPAAPEAPMHDPPHVEVLVNLACVCGGIAAGVSWTAQGPYFSHASRTHAALTGASVVATTARFAAIFGFIELLIESCVCRVGSAVSLIGATPAYPSIQRVGTDMDPWALVLLSSLASAGALAMFHLADFRRSDASDDAESEERSRARGTTLEAAGGKALVGVLSTLRLLTTSATALLLQSFSLLKGSMEVYIADYANGEITSPLFGSDQVGFFSAIGIGAGALCALATGPLSLRFGRACVMVVGILGFTYPALINAIYYALAAASLEAAIVVTIYVGWGIGRGVFDSTFRALAATLFPHQLEAIFAAVRFGEGLAATIAFKLCPCVGGAPLTAIILVLGSAALGCYWLAEHINGYPDTKGK